MELTIDNILDSEAAEHLFDPDFTFAEPEKKEDAGVETPKNDKTETKEDIADELDGETLFAQESVGDEDDEDKDKEDTVSDDDGSSPSNFYSSIARAALEDGVFTYLDDETIDGIKTAEDFGQALEKQVQGMLDDKQRRIDAALTAGVSDTTIQSYERTLDYLDGIDEKTLTAETEEGETLRKQLIYQDYLNRGFDKNRALREVKKSVDSTNDVEDAKLALQSNKEFFTEKYNAIIEEQEAARQDAINQRKKADEKLKKDILEGKDIFDGLTLDKATRQKVYDSIAKPAYRDKETGNVYTEIQKYESENREDFLKKIGLLYVMTDKFTKLDNLIGKQVNKEMKKGLKNLENTLNSTSRDSEGNLRLMTGVKKDKNSYSGIQIDI